MEVFILNIYMYYLCCKIENFENGFMFCLYVLFFNNYSYFIRKYWWLILRLLLL